MRDLYREQLSGLNQELIKMGAACEEIIALSSRALTDYSASLAEKVSSVGALIDESERTIETTCLKLLLRQQPVARDLRLISAALNGMNAPVWLCRLVSQGLLGGVSAVLAFLPQLSLLYLFQLQILQIKLLAWHYCPFCHFVCC